MVSLLVSNALALLIRQLGGLEPFWESSVASQGTRGPVAFRPRLSAGLALSLQLLTIVENYRIA